MEEFETFTREFEENVSQGEGVTMEGPSVACIGWIPFYTDTGDMPECAYKTHPLFTQQRVLPSALSMLSIGNPSDPGSDSNPSPAIFSDRTHFLKLIESKNYRGALALDEVKLTLTKQQRPLRISFKQLSDVGYTPFRVRYISRITIKEEEVRTPILTLILKRIP